tara:strand:+ start:107 stop:355 length:249 start_codon:yes stop_codon:yes gene_type:complete
MINIINNIDTEDLGEIMMDFAESLQLRGVNIVVCNISIEDLKNSIRFEGELSSEFLDGVNDIISEGNSYGLAFYDLKGNKID